MGCCQSFPNNQGLVLLAALTAIQISQGLDADQMATLSAFFSALGDNLGILSSAPLCPCPTANKKDTGGC